MEKTLTISGAQARKIYPTADEALRAILETNFGKEYFDNKGVWILTSNNEAVRASDWDKMGPHSKAIGIGVKTEKTAFMVSLQACAALQWGATGFEDYPGVCKDTGSYDNAGTTSDIIERHKGLVCQYSDSGKFDFTGAPAAEWCRSLGPLWSLPTLSTTKVIAENIKEINQALRSSGGFIIPNCWLWTSTVKDSGVAYVVFMFNGFVGYYDKGNDRCVRAVSAFQIEDFEFLNF